MADILDHSGLEPSDIFSSQTNAAEVLNAYTLPRQVTYEFTLQNMGPQVLQKAELRTYAPVKQTANQRCDAITASHPFELSIDDLGNQILYFKRCHLQ